MLQRMFDNKFEINDVLFHVFVNPSGEETPCFEKQMNFLLKKFFESELEY